MNQLTLAIAPTAPARELPAPARDPFLSGITFAQLCDFRALAQRDLVDAILASDEAAYITGTTLVVDGGVTSTCAGV